MFLDRSFPSQTGFTFDHETALNFNETSTTMNLLSLAQNDLHEATEQSCTGWYWGSIPFFLVGLTLRVCALALTHICDRGQQTKPSLLYEMKHRKSGLLYMKVIGMIALIMALLVVTGALLLR